MNRFGWIKLAVVLGALAFGATLAFIIGQRLSTEAMAVLLGVVAGIAASIPTSIIVVWIAFQTVGRQNTLHTPAPRAAHDTPQVVMVQPAPMPMAANGPAYMPQNWTSTPYPLVPAPAPHAPRKFTVIGGGAESEDISDLQPLEIEA